MAASTSAFVAAALMAAGTAVAQQSGWEPNQVAASMCYWAQPRVATVRNITYIDGGELWWSPTFNTGETGNPNSDGNPLGLIYTFNFGQAFNTSQNISTLLGTISKAPGGGAASNIAPNYFDGALLANDDEFYLYGGMLQLTAEYSAPDATTLLGYRAYQYGVERDAFEPGFFNFDLTNMTRYVAYGGAADAPSENKAWYFSGLRGPTWGPIYDPGANESLTAVNVSDTLITLDMTTQLEETFKNDTLPSYIRGRANPELIWVPIGSQGILVAIGGVIYPDFVDENRASDNATASEQVSPTFMSTIDVYDVAGGKWYQQPATGGPGQLTRGCTVLATAQDRSSFNIYWYGGYDGLNPTHATAYSDDVWVLSLPSFAWVKVATGTSGHSRAGHKCVKPYPDQMLVIGGTPGVPGCLENMIQPFNLSSGQWLDSYDPTVYSPYSVPEMVYQKIGGSTTGGATLTTPSPSGWATSALGAVFATPYPTSKLTTWYPYTPVAATNNTNPNLPQPPSSSSGTPSWLAPVLGSVLGLIALTSIAVAILLWKRRRLLVRAGGGSETETEDNNNHILTWIRGQPSETKAPTVTTTEDPPPMSPVTEPTTPFIPPPTAPLPLVPYEMPDTQVAELGDTSRPPELSDRALSPVEIINKHTHFAPGGLSVNNSSHYSSISQTDHASMISRSSGGPAVLIPVTPDLRPVSPGLGGGMGTMPTFEEEQLHHRLQQQQQQQQEQQQQEQEPMTSLRPPPQTTQQYHQQPQQQQQYTRQSDVSGLSDRDRAHLRNISDTTVSSMGVNSGAVAAAGDRPLIAPVLETVTASAPPTPAPPHAAPVSTGTTHSPVSPGSSPAGPVSPPSAGPGRSGEAQDYISARPIATTMTSQQQQTHSGGLSPGASSPGSVSRRSVFREEDMSGGPK